MKKHKTFDCVRMKDQIQEKLLSEWTGISDADLVQKIKRDLDASDSPLAAWWRHLDSAQYTPSRRSSITQ